MNKAKGSIILKSIAVLAEQIGLLATVISLLYIAQSSLSVNFNDFISRTSYADSTSFEETFRYQMEDLADYIKLYNNYTTNGTYDPEKIVDIKKYNETGVIDNTCQESIGYRVGDMLKWYQLRQSDGFHEENKISASYQAVNNIKLEDYIAQNISGEEQQEAFYLLINQVAESVYYDVMEYKTLLDKFDSTKTNLWFLVYDQNQEVILTNRNEQQLTVEQIKQLGKYITYDSVNTDYTTNTDMTIGYFNKLVGELASYGDYTLLVAVDTNLPIEDVFYKGSQSYRYFIIASSVSICSLLAVLISMIFLTTAAGHKKDTKEVILNSFDEIKTEIAGGIMLLIAGILTAIIFYTFENEIKIVFWVATENIFFMIGYMSFIRRVKARALWNNSILYILVRAWRNFYSYKTVTFQTVLIYCLFVIASVVVFVILFLGSLFFGGFLFVMLYGGAMIYLIQETIQRQQIIDGIHRIKEGDLEYKIETDTLKGGNRALAGTINHIGEGLYNAVEASMKNERLKTDLITNVSHDIKTPLTSIINYVDLLKREKIEDDKILGYIEVLESKSQRLKHLTEDLVEASKISSGNITLEFAKINFVELIHQTLGEFEEKFENKQLTIVSNLPKVPVYIYADSRRTWRIVENLFQNIVKYALPNTRVYIDLKEIQNTANLSIKNISEHPLNINADELTERFIRGDVSRSTEGSGLGLSIAKNLTELQKGTFVIYLDGDLFRVNIGFAIDE